MRKKLSKFFTFFMIGVCVGLFAYNMFKMSVQKVSDEEVLAMGFMKTPDVNRIIDKIKVENVMVKGIYERQELITMEVELAAEVLWDDSWTEDWFAKKQYIVYFGTGKYSTDLNTIGINDITFDHERKLIMVAVNKPQISSVEIDELQTVINQTENGILRFGEAKMYAVEFNQLTLKAKNKMRDEMTSGELMEEALRNTEDSVKSLYGKILAAGGFDDYIVEVSWKREI